MNSLSFGSPNNAWQQHNIQEYPILFNGSETDHKTVVRKNKLVAIVGKGYQLFPNEEALKIADQAAKLAGLQPFAPATPGLKKQGNAFYNKKETYMHAWYAPKTGYKIESENMKVGCDVQNSIDGTSAFGCGVFTYRKICGNGVIMGYKEISGFKRMHTKGLAPIIKSLKERMLLIMETAGQIIANYRQMANQTVTQNLIERISKSRIPAKVLPDYITKDEIEMPKATTEWDLYNDITEQIWHNAKTGLRTKTFQYSALHTILKV